MGQWHETRELQVDVEGETFTYMATPFSSAPAWEDGPATGEILINVSPTATPAVFAAIQADMLKRSAATPRSPA